MSYPITIDKFSGPLDLLLYLIEQNQLSINDISVVEITRQYMGYLRAAQKFNLELASEFLLVGATLLRIKIKTLLPADDIQNADGTEIEVGHMVPQSRDGLVQRLTQYKEFKEVSAKLAQLMEQRINVYLSGNHGAGFEAKFYGDLLPGITVEEIGKIASAIMSQGKNSTQDSFTQGWQEVNLGQVTEWIKQVLSHCHGGISFRRLVAGLRLRQRIAVFVSLLEMARKRWLTLKQDHLFGDVWVAKIKPLAGGGSELASRSH